MSKGMLIDVRGIIMTLRNSVPGNFLSWDLAAWWFLFCLFVCCLGQLLIKCCTLLGLSSINSYTLYKHAIIHHWTFFCTPQSPHEAKNKFKDIEKGEDDSDSSKAGTARKSLWNKFNFVQNIKHSQGTEQGMYLQDLAGEEVDPEVYALYFPER